MTTSSELTRCFNWWNVKREGPETLTSGNWRYYQSVLYYQGYPQKRFITAANGEKVCLHRHTIANVRTQMNNGILYDKEGDKVEGSGFKYWEVPDIGVFSRYPDDMLTTRELHERLAFVFLQELRYVREDYVDKTTAPDLEKKEASAILALVDRMYARHHNWSVVFGLNWDGLPKGYRDDIAWEIKRKIERYHEPKAVASRERANARKIALKAFGLTKKKAANR